MDLKEKLTIAFGFIIPMIIMFIVAIYVGSKTEPINPASQDIRFGLVLFSEIACYFTVVVIVINIKDYIEDKKNKH